jgi:hypothetical protein
MACEDDGTPTQSPIATAPGAGGLESENLPKF